MGSVGIGVADIVDDRDLAFLEQLGKTSHYRVEAEAIGGFDDLIRFESESGTKFGVLGIEVWDDGIEAVVSAGELADNEHVVGVNFTTIGKFDDIGAGDGREP